MYRPLAICLGQVDEEFPAYIHRTLSAMAGRKGAPAGAAEFGHTVIQPEGLLCTCGARGCLEMYCSGKALAMQASSIIADQRDKSGEQPELQVGRWSDAALVIRAGRAGSRAALEALGRAFYYVGLGIANLIGISNPRLVILGGGIVANWPEGISIVRSMVRSWVRIPVRERVRVEQAALGDAAGLIGAAVLVRDRRVEDL